MAEELNKLDYNTLLNTTFGAIGMVAKSQHDAEYLSVIVERSKIAVHGEYLGICSLVNAHMGKSNGLDRHKRLACHMVAILHKLQIREAEYQYEPYRERLAIWAGMLALDALLIAGDSNDPHIEAFLTKNKKLELPEPVCDHGSYAENWAIRLRLAYKRSHDKVVLALLLSNELFLIENHNRMLSRM
jgi:hypothetical protein